ESGETRALEEGLSDLQLRLMRSENAKERTALLDQLVENERRLELTRTDRKESKPGWFQKPAPLKAVQSSPRADELLPEYVLSEPHSYCVWTSTKSAGVKALPAGRKQIEEVTRKFLDETRAKRDDIGLARQLYNVLLSPIPQEATSERLIVVPDGILNLLPFDTLRDETGSLLVERKTNSYAPACSVLTVIRNVKEAQSARRTCLGVGDVPYQNQG